MFSLSFLAESKPKELPPLMPVMMIKAITQDKKSTLICYECPIYKTRQRGPTYVWTFELKTKGSPSKWVLAGVALLLQNWLLTMLFKLYSSTHTFIEIYYIFEITVHYFLWLVYFLPHFWRPFLLLTFFCKIMSLYYMVSIQECFVIKHGLYWRAYGNSECCKR